MFRSRYDLPYGSSGGMLPYLEDYDEQVYMNSDECKCSCNQCERPKRCCREVCISCSQQQPNVVLLPYPYPLVVTRPSTTCAPTTTTVASTTTTTSTTPTTSTTSTTPATVSTTSTTVATIATTKKTPELLYDVDFPSENRKISNDLDIDNIIVRTPKTKNSDGKFILTSLRRTKVDWRPKYGIVPIPDHLAEKLMSQLRHMRNINSR
jgi:hypothetical protein